MSITGVDVAERAWVQMGSFACQFKAFTHEFSQVDDRLVDLPAAMAGPAGAQYLFDRMEQPVSIVEHGPVKFLLPPLIDFTSLESFQIKTDRSDRRLKFVCDRVDKTVVLFIAADFAHQVDRVEHQTGDDEDEKDNPQHQPGDMAPMHDNPADIERNRQGDHAHTHNGEEIDRFTINVKTHRKNFMRSLMERKARGMTKQTKKDETYEKFPISYVSSSFVYFVISSCFLQSICLFILRQGRDTDFFGKSELFKQPDAIPVDIYFVPGEA